MHYIEGCKFASEKNDLDSYGNSRWLSLFLIEILKFGVFVFNFFIYAINNDENGVDKSDDQKSNHAVISNLLEVLEIIYSHRVTIVGNIASN